MPHRVVELQKEYGNYTGLVAFVPPLAAGE
jgi:hypothetical protein